MLPKTAIEIDQITKEYAGQCALNNISLSIASGSISVLIGHNGAGKSTLLETIATLRTPTSGSLAIGGYDSVRDARDARRMIGLAPQSNSLDTLATTEEALRFHGAALGLARNVAARRSRELMDLFGLTEHRKTRISQLSGGTRRKVDLALALIADPPLIILDEPTTGLDPISRLEFWEELKKLNQVGTTLLLSTQDLHEADALATDVIVLRDGQVVAEGPPNLLKEQVGDRTLTLTMASHESVATLLANSRTPFRADPRSDRTVTLAIPNTANALAEALTEISRVAGAVEQLSIAEPSLDDVFVAFSAR